MTFLCRPYWSPIFIARCLSVPGRRGCRWCGSPFFGRWGGAVIKGQIGGRWLPEWHGGQSQSMKSSFIDWRQERRRAVIQGQSVGWRLPVWERGQLTLWKSPLRECWQKSDQREWYSQRTSNIINETALRILVQVEEAVGLSTNHIMRLPIHFDSTLIQHCTCVLFRKIDCQQ